jgi:hypothetical protein
LDKKYPPLLQTCGSGSFKLISRISEVLEDDGAFIPVLIASIGRSDEYGNVMRVRTKLTTQASNPGRDFPTGKLAVAPTS